MSGLTLQYALPEWLRSELPPAGALFASPQDRMAFVVRLLREHVQRRTGGPFAAGIFTPEGALVSVGLNVVVPQESSVLHAETTAICFAQQALRTHDLSPARLELVTTAEPCAMCSGALCWSGVRSLICGATTSDVEAIGFDEGPQHPQWVDALRQRGIAVTREVLREECAELLRAYHAQGGEVYNPR